MVGKTVHRKIEVAFLLIILLAFIAWSVGFILRSSTISIDGKRYFSLFDDAMVSMRYAWNLSHGEGLVWNTGERVEGYTNLLMTLIMSLPLLVVDKSIAVLIIQIIGIFLMIGIAFQATRIMEFFTREMSEGQRSFLRVLVWLFSLAYYPLIFWTLMGMETGVLTFLLLTGVKIAIQSESFRVKNGLFFGFINGLAYLARPDAAIFAVLLFAYRGWMLIQKPARKNLFKGLMPAVAVFLLIVLGQLLFRWCYYGELLPNTYTLKIAGMPLGDRLRGGFEFTRPFMQGMILILIFSLSDLLFNYSREKILINLTFLCALAYTVYIGGDAWPFWRITSPAVPLLFIGFLLAVHTFIVSLAETGFYQHYFLHKPIVPRALIPGFLVCTLVFLGLALSNYAFRREIFFLQKAYTTGANANNIRISIALRDILKEDATVGVTAAGVIPYYTGLKAVDFLGKSDVYIAHLPPDLSGDIDFRPGHIKYNLEYSIKQLQPTYVETFEWGVDKIKDWAAEHYVIADYRGVSLRLLKESPHVRWNLITEPLIAP